MNYSKVNVSAGLVTPSLTEKSAKYWDSSMGHSYFISSNKENNKIVWRIAFKFKKKLGGGRKIQVKRHLC